jgi:hypothetical protein
MLRASFISSIRFIAFALSRNIALGSCFEPSALSFCLPNNPVTQ